jgi:hypothetical protein
MIPEARRPKIVNYSDEAFWDVFKTNQIKNESAKLALLTDNKVLVKGVQLKEALFTDTVGFVMRRNHFLYWLTEETLRDLINGGIPQYIENFYLEWFNSQASIIDKNDPKILSIDDLNYGFVIWSVAISITLIVFIAEFLMKYFVVKLCNGVKNKLQKFLGLIFVIGWLRKYLKQK